MLYKLYAIGSAKTPRGLEVSQTLRTKVELVYRPWQYGSMVQS